MATKKSLVNATEALPYLVFTYGTLKRAEPNHYIINAGKGKAEFLAEARTVNKYPLIIASKYNVPFLLDRQGAGHREMICTYEKQFKRVIGEIYRVNAEKLAELDDLEDHPQFYCRRQEATQMSSAENQDKIVSAWIYFLPHFREELLSRTRTHLSDYSSLGEHGLPYVARYAISSDEQEQRSRHYKEALLPRCPSYAE